MTNGSNDNVNELITRYLAGEASADEQEKLFSWIAADPGNKRHYDDLQKAFQLTTEHFNLHNSSDLNIDIGKEWNRFTENIGEKKTRQLSLVQMSLRIAATVLLLLATGSILYYNSSFKTTTYQTAGSQETVALPDGSQVILNRHTLLSYKTAFGKETRTVNLEGEAFFEVKPDASKPFVILTQKTKVQVLGTSFNVNAYDSLSETEVIVRTGVVSFQTKGRNEKVKLVAGQKGVYSNTTERLGITVNKDVNFLAWNTRRIIFVENDLATVIETLRKIYHANITISTVIPSTCVVTVTFDHQSLESIMRVLENTLNLKYTIRGNNITITEAGC
jgi:transmembrane sensor